MHGNTFSAAGGQTRRLDDILQEIAGFFAAHRQEGTIPGGVHVELTSDDVTECLGGSGRSSRAVWATATRPCATRASTGASPSTWPSRWPSSCEPAEQPEGRAGR